MKLYEIAGAIREIEARIDAKDGEIEANDLADLDSLELTLSEKLDAICAIVRERTARAEALSEESARLRSLAASETAIADRLKAHVKSTMDALDLKRADAGRFRVTIASNSAPSITWARELDDLPEHLRKVSVSLDWPSAVAAYRAGTLPDGFEVKTGTHLRIR